MEKQKREDYILLTLFCLFVAVILVLSHMSSVSLHRYAEIVEENIFKRQTVTGKIAAKLIDPEIFASFDEPSDMTRDDYTDIQKMLTEFAEENELEFVYYMRPANSNRIQFIVDSDPDPATRVGLDYYEDIDPLVEAAFSGTPAYSKLGEYTEDWQGILAAYFPVYGENGDIAGAVGIDVSDEQIMDTRGMVTRMTWIQFASVVFVFVLGIVGILVFRRRARGFYDASVAKGQFLSRMSHEIRTPMNAIIGLCRMAQNTDDQARIADYLSNINSSSNYLLQLINNVLDISKIESGKMTLTMEKASLFRIIEDIRVIMSEQTKPKNQILLFNTDKRVPDFIYCDITYLKQIIINLISNAIKFTPQDGEIDVTMKLLENTGERCHIMFSIKDNGIGIEQKYIPHLFEPFEQGDGSTTRKYGGTGLGLAISKMLVGMMEGSIRAESETGKGSTFIFDTWHEIVKPADYPDTETAIEAEPAETAPRYDGECFLVVEDNEINQMITRSVLEELGAEVDIASDGREGVDKYTTNPEKYNLIFMDIQMPVMDGFEAVRLIRASGKHNAKTIPIIAMTANVFKEDVEKAKEAGMNAHIGKPFEIGQIVSTISALRTQNNEKH